MHKNKMTETNKQNMYIDFIIKVIYVSFALISPYLFGLLFYYRDFVYNASFDTILTDGSTNICFLVNDNEL